MKALRSLQSRQLWRLLVICLAAYNLIVSALLQGPQQTLMLLLVWGGALIAWDPPDRHWWPQPGRRGFWLGVLLVLLALWRGQQFVDPDGLTALLPLLASTGLVLLAAPPLRLGHLGSGLLILALLAPLQALTLRLPTELLARISALLGQALLLLAGLPATTAAHVLSLPGGSVAVLSGCAGADMVGQALLVALIFALAFPLRRRWHNLLMLPAAMALAMLSNGIRIASLALLAASPQPWAPWWFDMLHKHQGALLFGGLGILLFVVVYERCLTIQVRQQRQH